MKEGGGATISEAWQERACKKKNRLPWLSLAGTKIVLDDGLGRFRHGVEKPGAVTGPKENSCCEGPLMRATVLVTVLGPARSSCAQKKKGAGETRHVLGS